VAPRLSTRLVVLLAVVALFASLAAEAQDARGRKPARIGRLSPLSAEADRAGTDAFHKGMRDLGWIEGTHYVMESRFADGKGERLPALATDLVKSGVDLIVSGSSPGALAAKNATKTIPIVMVTTGDPVGDGIVTSLSRPGSNVTGVTALGQALNGKRLELIKEALPGVSRMAILVNPTSFYTPPLVKEKDAAAKALGLDVRLYEAATVADLDRAFAAMSADRIGAVVVQTTAFYITHHKRIVALAAQRRLPAIYGGRDFVEAGGLMFYGATLPEMYREAASYVDRILKGAKPGDLPVEQPTKLDLIINLKTAKALGLTISPSVLLRATETVER
jgi:putative ABC transport system substrate-binding protein